LVQEVQHHSPSGKVLHVDPHEVVETESERNRRRGNRWRSVTSNQRRVLEHVLFKLKVRGLPKDLPEASADVTNLDIGKSIHIGDITRPQASRFWATRK
jgi:hypothetical protein